MWVYISYVLATLGVSTGFLLLVWYTNPAPLMKFLLRLPLIFSGMKVKYVPVDDLTFCYAERGTKKPGVSSLVFIHGFSASKDMWPAVIRRLPKDLHLIVVDLPGHGGTSEPTRDEDLTVEAMTKAVHKLINTLGLDSEPFHLTGTSLGGAIAALYAVKYPQQLQLLTVVCPAMRTPIETEFMRNVRNGICPLLPQSEEELQEMLDLCFFHKQKLNKQMLKGIFQLRKVKTPFYSRLLNIIQDVDETNDRFLDDVFRIEVPSQVIWGENDQLIHVSGAQMLKENLLNIQDVQVFEHCGHSVIMDRPGLFVKHLLLFRQRQAEKAKLQ